MAIILLDPGADVILLHLALFIITHWTRAIVVMGNSVKPSNRTTISIDFIAHIANKTVALSTNIKTKTLLSSERVADSRWCGLWFS